MSLSRTECHLGSTVFRQHGEVERSLDDVQELVAS